MILDREPPSISTAFQFSMTAAAVLTTAVIGAFWIMQEYKEFNESSTVLRTQFVDEQKAIIRREVEEVIDYIEYRRSKTEERLRQSLEDRVGEAHAIALNIVRTSKDSRTRAELEELVKNALRPIRFAGGRGYFFAVSMEGVEKLYPVAPQFEDENLLDLQDEMGNYVIRDEIAVIRRDGAGFVRDFWRKPDAPEGMIFSKMTFVRYFEPFDWYLGTGEYVDDVDRDLQNELIERIAKVRFGNQGYVFVNTYAGDAIVTDGEIVTDGRNLWDLVDPTGVKVIQEERRAVDDPQGAFINYTWRKLTNTEPAPKVSFIKGIPEWQWMIGAGVYLDEIETEIAAGRLALRRAVRMKAYKIVAIMLALVLVIVLLTRMFTRRAKRGIDAFMSFFQRAAVDSTTIDESRLHFSEFVTMARAANAMIEDRRRIEGDNRELAERMSRSRKMEALGLLTGGVAHDLNNILSGIVSYPDMLLMDKELDDEMRPRLEIIKESGLRAAAVVADLLAASRGGQGASEALNINDAVTAYLRSPEHRSLADARPGVQVLVELDRNLLNVRCSRAHLAKTLTNLVANGIEAIDGRGAVTISTENRYLEDATRGYEEIPAGEYALLRVADDGGGISTADLARVFEPFFTRKVLGRSGTGLGLTVVWHTVHDHGGYIDVSSDGGGTAIDLYFPVTRETLAVETEALPPSAYVGNGERILVVDDEPGQRTIAAGLLARLGYRVDAVESGKAAVSWLADNDADLVVLDMILGAGMNGCDTFEEILKLKPGQKAVIASGFAETEDVQRAIGLGAGLLIHKPYTIQEIGVAVRDELRR